MSTLRFGSPLLSSSHVIRGSKRNSPKVAFNIGEEWYCGGRGGIPNTIKCATHLRIGGERA